MKKITLKSKKAPRNAKKSKGGRTRTPEQAENYRAIRQSIAADKSKLHEWRPEYEAFTKPAEKEFRKAEKELKARQITENKVKADWERKRTGKTWTPNVFREELFAQITSKLGEYSYTEPDKMDKLSEIMGYDIKNLVNPNNDIESVRTKHIRDFMEVGLDRGLYSETDLVDMYRKLEAFDRKERYHITGLDERFDPKAAKDIYEDIIGSSKVSDATKEILSILGPKGVILYLNYRNIMKLQYGDLYQSQLYNPAATVFWELPAELASKINAMDYRAKRSAMKDYHDSVKGFGYKPGYAKKQREGTSYLAGVADAVQFTKYAISFMGYDEHLDFLKEVERKSSLAIDWQNVI